MPGVQRHSLLKVPCEGKFLKQFCSGDCVHRVDLLPPNASRRLPFHTYLPPTTIMVSASKAAREAKRAAAGKDKKTVASKAKSQDASNATSKASSVNGDEENPANGDEVAEDPEAVAAMNRLALQEDKDGISDRVTTGVLASLETSRDVKIISSSLVFHGKVLIADSTLEVSFGRRYGLLGENGCGKSTLLKAIDKREFPFPEAVDIYLLNEGAPKTDQGALEWVVKQAENELQRLESLSEEILEKDGPESPMLQDIYDVSFVEFKKLGVWLTSS